MAQSPDRRPEASPISNDSGQQSALSSLGHSVSFPVRFNELDPYGHVNHAVYFSYMEFGRTEALNCCQLSLADIATEGFQMVVTGIDAKFRLPAGAGDVVTVVTRIAQRKRASAVWSQQVVRQGGDSGDRGDEVLLTASIVTAVTDLTGRPVKPPSWLFDRLAPLESDDGEAQ